MSDPEDQIYGQGIDLLDNEGRQWDIAIQDGDIAVVRGVGELEKDISYKIRRTLGPVEGIVLTPTLQSKIENAVTRVLNDDQRIREVDNVTVEMVEREIEPAPQTGTFVRETGGSWNEDDWDEFDWASKEVDVVTDDRERKGSKHDELLIDVECTAIGSGVDLEIVL